MDIRRIRAEDLKLTNFTFMEMTESSEAEWRGQSFAFDGVVFGICMKGRLGFRVDYRELELTSGRLMILLPKHIFTPGECSSDLEMRLLLISPDFMYTLPVPFDLERLKQIEVSPSIGTGEREFADITALYDMQRGYDDGEAYSAGIRRSLVLSLVLVMLSVIDRSGSGRQELTVSRQEKMTHAFFDLMLQNYESHRSVSFYADKLCVTPKNLSNTVKGVTGHTVQEWLNEVVTIEAKRSLKISDMSVMQISERLHFTTPSSFVRFFRLHAGCTPLEYRKKQPDRP